MSNSNPIKCVVTDLDNTLWNGILREDDSDALILDDEYADRLRGLDKQGILLSIASRNDEEVAVEVLRRMKLGDLFVAPRINDAPKSQNVAAIRDELNIGADSIVFVDDQQFELAEVSSALPEVKTILKRDYKERFDELEFAIGTTWEARNRKLLYNAQARRKEFQDAANEGTNTDFLRSLGIKLGIKKAREEDLERATELILRSHQLNFSANTYSLEEVRRIFADGRKDIYLVQVSDRFGPYGIVGVAIVDKRDKQWFVQDLLFSCRIQGRGIESATLAYLVRKAQQSGISNIEGAYRKTKQNVNMPSTYTNLGFTPRAECDLTVYSISTTSSMPDFEHLTFDASMNDVVQRGVPFVRDFIEGYLRREYPTGFPSGFSVIDVGAGWGEVLGEDWTGWVKTNLGEVVYTKLDKRQYGSYIDVIADAETMSSDPRIGKGRYDLALAFEVLEHSRNPRKIVEEMGRVAKPTGTMIASVPYNQPPHYEPEDYWRFKPDEFKALFSGYRIVDLKTEGPYDNPRRTLIVAKLQ
ncbi:MAG: HAD-IIIC family phosphatase [Candidatus Aenigmarchaeota archaeon]|nr:HAD-IIIC family phosphatase [Candidatus Aenigmarchaeota archaeon]